MNIKSRWWKRVLIRLHIRKSHRVHQSDYQQMLTGRQFTGFTTKKDLPCGDFRDRRSEYWGSE